MVQKGLVNLHENFQLPIVRARLDTLLSLANALRPSLRDLYRALPTRWVGLLETFAEIVARELTEIRTASDAEVIWNQFRGTVSVSKLGEGPLAVLESVSTRLTMLLKNGDQSLKYLAQANQQAVDWIRAVGHKREISSFARVTEVPLNVYYDAEAREYCASSSQTMGEIGWKLQLKKHALYGALIPDMLFEHEYISHLLPLNCYLSDGVREVWLDCALYCEQKNSSTDRGQTHVDLVLWDEFRRELARHFNSDIELYGPPRLDMFAYSLYRYPPGIFWNLTSQIMHVENNRAKADLIHDLLAKLTELDDQTLYGLLANKWQTLDELYSAVRSLSY